MATRGARSAAAAPATTEKLYMENTLLRVAGALFCHDAKRAPTRTDKIELNKGITEKSIIIRPDPELGQPGPLAHKIFVALIKKHSGYGRAPQTDVSFTKRELMRLIGRTEWGGSASEQLDRALTEIHHAFVRTGFKAEGRRFVEHSFNIFPEIYLERRERPTDPIEACTVTLARPIIVSLQDGHFTCLNHTLMEQLGTIGQALYMRLFFHFANLYDGHHKNRLSFSKRYDDICREWLGGLAPRQFQSVIERDQLGPHLRHLTQAQFLSSYVITKASGREGFVIAFRPGAAFFADYDRFYRRRERGGARFDFGRDQQDIAEPLKVAYLFIEKRHGRPPGGIPYVPSKDVDTAKHLLAQLSFDDVRDFIDYALAEAHKTHFEVQTLGGLRQYLSTFIAGRERHATARAANERSEYDRFQRTRADEVFASLSAKEQAAIEAAATASAPTRARGDGSLAKIMIGIERARITVERHPRKVPSFETWQAARRR